MEAIGVVWVQVVLVVVRALAAAGVAREVRAMRGNRLPLAVTVVMAVMAGPALIR